MAKAEDSSEFRPNRIRSHRDLTVWRKGIDLAVATYRLAKNLPRVERYVLKEQMLRASVSIPSNVAEGHGRMSKGDFVRHLGMSRGSLQELETHIELCKRLGYFDDAALSRPTLLADEVECCGHSWKNAANVAGSSVQMPQRPASTVLAGNSTPASYLLPPISYTASDKLAKLKSLTRIDGIT